MSVDAPTDAQVEAFVDAAAAALRLPLAAEHRPGVLRYFGLAAGMAAQLEAAGLTIDDEPAPAFVPIVPIVPIPAAGPAGEEGP